MREWLQQRLGEWRRRRAEKKQQAQWAAAVKTFNLMIPQARLVVYASLLKDNEDLRLQFRRALQMQDAPKGASQAPEEEARIITLGSRAAKGFRR